MRKKLATSMSIAFLLGSIATAGAENRAETFTLTPFLGGYTFEGGQHQDTSPVVGLRGGYNFTPRFGAELVMDYTRTDGPTDNVDTNIYNYHMDLLYHMFPSSRFVPFLMAGVGGITLDGDTIDTDQVAYNYGLGVKYALTDSMDLRGEVRHILYRNNNHTVDNLEYGVGLGFNFGGVSAPSRTVEVEAPVAEPVVQSAAEPAVQPVVEPVRPAPAPVQLAAPRGSISVTPSTVVKGTATTLTWQCLDSESAQIKPGIGQVASQGSKSITAADPAEYTLTCSGPGGKSTSTARLSVTEPPRPRCSITAIPDTIVEGQTSRLDWDCINAEAAEIGPAIGKVAIKGSRTVTPAETTSYTITGSSAHGSATGSSTVKVNPLPPERRAISLDVRFDTGKAVVKKEYHDEIGRVASFLKEYPGVTGTIEGHTDNVGSRDMNLKLSQRRADAVLNYLVQKYGIERSRLSAVGYGPDKPIADNKTAEGKLKNRRTVASFETMVPRKK